MLNMRFCYLYNDTIVIHDVIWIADFYKIGIQILVWRQFY